jgi:plastocyanin
MKIARRLSAVLVALCLAGGLPAAYAQDKDAFTLTLKDHKFQPEELQVPAGKKFRLVVKNLDSTAEEFESHDLKREKVIAGNSEATLSIGPLKAGTYRFVGEYNEKTAKGRIVAK